MRDTFIRILQPGREGEADALDLDRIDVVTASAKSRLGNPIDGRRTGRGRPVHEIERHDSGRHHAAPRSRRHGRPHTCVDERMGSRARNSYAQQVFENAEDDVFVFYRNPDLAKSLRHRDGRPLDFNLKSERLKMLEYVYRGSPWVDLNSIESEAKALMKTDPTQAERFFGNRLVQGGGAWLEDGLWESCYAGA